MKVISYTDANIIKVKSTSNGYLCKVLEAGGLRVEIERKSEEELNAPLLTIVGIGDMIDSYSQGKLIIITEDEIVHSMYDRRESDRGGEKYSLLISSIFKKIDDRKVILTKLEPPGTRNYFK